MMSKYFRKLDLLITKKVLRNIQDLNREVTERFTETRHQTSNVEQAEQKIQGEIQKVHKKVEGLEKKLQTF